MVNLLRLGLYGAKPTDSHLELSNRRVKNPVTRGFYEDQHHTETDRRERGPKQAASPAREGRARLGGFGGEGSARTAHEADGESGALDEARTERVEAAGRLVRAGRGEDPAERRGRGLPRADAAGGLLGGEVGAARGHPGGGGGGGAASRRVERGDGGMGERD